MSFGISVIAKPLNSDPKLLLIPKKVESLKNIVVADTPVHAAVTGRVVVLQITTDIMKTKL